MERRRAVADEGFGAQLGLGAPGREAEGVEEHDDAVGREGGEEGVFQAVGGAGGGLHAGCL